jgi:hypothetical protein
MLKRDYEDGGMGILIGLVIIVAVIIFIVYLIMMFIGIIIGIAAGIGVLYGGGTAIANYASSFKENIIDSNKKNGGIVEA